MLVADRTGMISTSSLTGIYSYEQKLSDKLTLKAGLQASLYQKTLDLNGNVFSDSLDSRFGFPLPSGPGGNNNVESFGNYSAGLLLYSENFYVGFAFHNITGPTHSFFNSNISGAALPRRYTVHGGMTIPLDSKSDLPLHERTTINPNILVMKQSVFNQANISLYLNRSFVTTGLGCRLTSENPDGVIAMLGVRIKKKFTLAYSYDRTIFKVFNFANNSHEISMSLKWRSKASEPEGGRIICPAF
jgi:type IX secretion system PorP/SprF family membrane protein